jgi:hypothetical protein
VGAASPICVHFMQEDVSILLNPYFHSICEHYLEMKAKLSGAINIVYVSNT